jgi:hypothetical protein
VRSEVCVGLCLHFMSEGVRVLPSEKVCNSLCIYYDFFVRFGLWKVVYLAACAHKHFSGGKPKSVDEVYSPSSVIGQQ